MFTILAAVSKADWSQVQAARQLLARHFVPTRLAPAASLNRGASAVYLKLESEMPTGSFKVRGALYALQTEVMRGAVTEVVASSTGNHGAAVAYAGKLSGIPTKIFLPVGANPTKVSRIRAQGGAIVELGKDISEATHAAQEYATRNNAFFLNDADSPDVPAGTATIAIEIVEQVPNVTTIFVPMGDTALIRGVAYAARHLRPEIQIIGVQAKQAPSYYLSWKGGVVVTTDTCDTIADGLATRSPILENVVAIRELVDDVRLVTETEMLNAIAHLLTKEQIVAEPAGAATTAAWLADSAFDANQSVVLLVTGANISDAVLEMARESAAGQAATKKQHPPRRHGATEFHGE